MTRDAVDDAVDDAGDDSTMSNSKNTSMPVGFMWDELNYSCAYNTLFTILYDIWIYKPLKWSRSFEYISPHMRTLDVTRGKNLLEIIRDNIRNYLYKANNMAFPCGKVGTSVIGLAIKMLCDSDSAGIETITCIKCNNHIVMDRSPMFIMYIKDKIHKSISEWFKYWHYEPSGSCVKCKSPQQLVRHYNETPRLYNVRLFWYCMRSRPSSLSNLLETTEITDNVIPGYNPEILNTFNSKLTT
jgi:hypothetical protein